MLAGQVDVGNNIKLGNEGVITATSFSGVMSGTTGSFSGQVNVGSNIKLGTAGVITATSFSGSGANLTNLNASNIASGTVPTARLGSGTANSSTFLRGDSTFQTVNTDLVSDTSPQLGGDLDVNNFNIKNGTAILDISTNQRFEFDVAGTEIVDINGGGLRS